MRQPGGGLRDPGLLLRKVPIDPNSVAVNKGGGPGPDRNPDGGPQADAAVKMGPAIHQDLWQGKEGLEEAVAIRCGNQSLSFGTFFQEILRAEAGLRARGVGPGDLVTILSLNTPEAVPPFMPPTALGRWPTG